MTDSTPQYLHDRLFREGFGRTEVARSFLEEYLPPEIGRRLDLDTLTRDGESFIDDELREHRTDLLYRALDADDKPIWVYLLFEHKSSPDPDVALQLLRYMVRIWVRQREAGEPLSPIMPLVVYHGDRRWRVAKDFQGLFGEDFPPELANYTPQFSYLLRNFSWRESEQLRGNVLVMTALLTLQAAYTPADHQQIERLAQLWTALETVPDGVDFLRTVLYYVTRTATADGRLDPDRMRTALEAQGSQGAEIVTTWLQERFEQGEQTGLQKGVQQTQERIARRMLTRNQTLTMIQEFVELSPMEIIPLWREERAREASVTLSIDERHAHATRDRQIIRELLAIYDDAVTVSELSGLPVETILAMQAATGKA